MNRSTMLRFAFLLLALTLTTLAGVPAAQAGVSPCCLSENWNCAAECADWGGIAEFDCLPIGGSCKYYCACNL
jgi:hypothetical protein